MRNYLCLLIPVLLLSIPASAQPKTLPQLNDIQSDTLEIGMLVLGGWAIVNILISSFKLTRATRNRKYFYQMNLYWNLVNLIIASVALYSILSKDQSAQNLADSLYLHSWYKKVLYLNVGLDLGYMLLGAYLKERSRNSYKAERLMGWGQAVILQGLFLLLLDVVLVVLLESIAGHLFRLVPQL
ncbi:DUF6992 family protein [Pontibacter oryzae]|uniref:DUF4386 family protein n=1 Tax=Pontibacter oryzae TaxID=2304593 RepID=A0A399S063_9BACT|nr:hypothetical protein [Pontibacter oryzae]RIJ37396.1 hypothetical protein D1627_09705 [Pontibacter oryzae]